MRYSVLQQTSMPTVYPKKYAHGFCFAVLCCGYTLTDFPISIRLTSLALWQSNDCPSASKATLMNMDKCFMWIHYERLHNHNKAKHNKTVCIFLGIYCIFSFYHVHVTRFLSMDDKVFTRLHQSKTHYVDRKCHIWKTGLGTMQKWFPFFQTSQRSTFKNDNFSCVGNTGIHDWCLVLPLPTMVCWIDVFTI